ncbi:2-polyprenyl-6-methoxyphenol hydroxylase-like FAD-dependent oxidoreductase [Ochrobactrum sp. RH1CCR137]|uniref:FAD-dependent oxidoreductase n=1 Tax=Brucella intermedia TaxID=94625 RepID=UPI000DD9FB48|nr:MULTISPECIES: FAD-dependent oxidoreductase [Brucella/Ochrobactrum group]KAB2670332.1 FAD-dependent oxidoreductase [Ochrobactrum sp. LMG 5442]MBA8845559.1 2-polyprenyl-6-methoxyphenol hydroxylase-like FAD-dependent oxidoreductase [Ochrobactrum sp. RH1CCR137]MBA8857281.1 2-polyprenyl-6-methoxyphenol hydroxylase-like FAD-dependent oxidoreductase [Ochrobactrum sp. RH1CCR134]
MTQPVTSHSNSIKTDCVIAGGGPAGLMLGLLLARSGVSVTVLEKHPDFLRDFRGDTIHPSTLQIMHELGLLDGLLTLPHTKAYRLHAEIGGQDITIADFSRIPARCRFIAFMPQWEFLDYIAREAAKYPNFKLIMPANVVDLIERDGNVTGLVAATPDETINISAKLVVGADGRNSVVRTKAGMEIESFGSPSEILWMKLSHLPDDPPYTMGHGGPRQGFVMIDRGDYWQCGYVLRKQTFAEVKQKGLDAFREAVAKVSPLPPDRMDEIHTWDDVHLLSVRIDRLKKWWKPGLLCIGDAAHAMSPIGGFGVNLAIQDAVAAANILAAPLKSNDVLSRHLAAVEARRRFPTKATQKLQLMMRSDRRKRETKNARPDGPPAFMRHLARWPILAHLAGRLIGVGFRPEHVRSN